MSKMLERLLVGLSVVLSLPLAAENAVNWHGFNLNSNKHVLEVQQDSRRVRELNRYGTGSQKQAYRATLDHMQKRATDDATRAMKAAFNNDPRYKGVQFTRDEFSTPGTENKNKINTDYDVRFGFRDGQGNFHECCKKVAEKAFLKSWSQQTGGPRPDATLDKHRHHAEKFRFVVTDKWHMEAPKDYTDQNSKAVSNFKNVKESQTILLDPEDLGRVYHEKADEQFRQARAIEQQLKTDSSLNPKQRTKLVEKKKSHQAEGVMQTKKAIQALDASRASYARQGYNVGRTPNALRSQMDAVLSFQGTMSDNVDAMMNRLGGSHMADGFNRQVSSQIESLKWAKKTPDLPKNPDLPRPRVNKGSVVKRAGIVGDILSIKERLKQAEQGSNWMVNFKHDDSTTETAAKALVIAAAELLPHGPTDLMDRGFNVDEKIKKAIKASIKSGEPLSDAYIGAMIVGGTAAETMKQLVIDPIVPVAGLIKETLWDSPRDLWDRTKEAFNRKASAQLQLETHTAVLEFQNRIDLAPIQATRSGADDTGSHFSGHALSPDDSLLLSIERNDQWEESLVVQWSVWDSKKSVIVQHPAKPVGGPSALQLAIPPTFLKRRTPGSYTVQVNVSDPVSGQTAYQRHVFSISDYFAFGPLQVLDENDQPRTNGIQPGDRIKVKTKRGGSWDDRYLIEWLFNGEMLKNVPASDPKADYIVLGLDAELSGVSKIAVRAVDLKADADWLVAHESVEIKIGMDKKVPAFEVSIFRDKVDGPQLSGPIRNGDILAFSAEVPMLGAPGSPLMGDLTWQLFDPRGQPIKAIVKYARTSEEGGVRSSSIRFLADSLINGEYAMTLTHSKAKNPKARHQAQSRFEVFQPVLVTRAWVTKQKNGTSHQSTFKTGDELYLYVSYEVGEGVTELARTLRVKHAKSGEVLAQIDDLFAPKNKTGSDKTGIKLPRNKFNINDRLVFEALLAGPGEPPVSQQAEFDIKGYRIGMRSPRGLKVGQSASLRLDVPQDFRAPYSVDIESGGLRVSGIGGSSLSGAIEARSGAFAYDQAVKVSATIVDADGRQGSIWASINVVVPPPPPQPKIIPSTPSPAPSAVAETADQDNPWEELQDQLIDIQTQYYQDKAAAEAESQRRQDEINAKYNNLLSPPPPSPSMSGSSNTGSSCTCGFVDQSAANFSRSPAGGYTPGQSYSLVYKCCGRNETHTVVTDNKGFPTINGVHNSYYLEARRKQCGCK